MAERRIVIVGGGPAGIRAAEAVVAAGLRPILVDEAVATGGQIYRRQPAGFRRPATALYGRDAEKALAVHATFERIRPLLDYRPDTLAWNIQPGELYILRDGVSRTLPFDALIVAAGATDRIFPIPGWTLPGVFTLGAAQIALKAQACAIGTQVVFLGTGPLLYLVAYQYLKAGAGVAAVLDTSAAAARLGSLSALASRPLTLAAGLGYMAHIRRAGAVIRSGIAPTRIEGTAAGVEAVRYVDGRGREREIACDAVAFGYHLRAETQLADLAGCRFAFHSGLRQWLPEVDDYGRTSIPGVYLAGDGARLAGADAAEISGALAAHAALNDLGQPVSEQSVARLLAEQRRMERFRDGLFSAFAWPHRFAKTLPDDALVCRCESISAGTLRRAATELGAPEVNRAKAFSRVGMGRCQGRYCGLASAEIVAAALDLPVEAVGRLRGQGPVKPLPAATRVEA